jgi:hypothetical protein
MARKKATAKAANKGVKVKRVWTLTRLRQAKSDIGTAVSFLEDLRDGTKVPLWRKGRLDTVIQTVREIEEAIEASERASIPPVEEDNDDDWGGDDDGGW